MKDESKVDKLMKIIEELHNTKVEIGIIGDEKHRGANDFTVLGVAKANEFGFKNIPERPFLRGTYDKKLSEIQKNIDEWATQVLEFELDINAFWEMLGQYGVDITKQYLTDLNSPPNSPVTIERKGSSNPLIDTGQLRDSITYKVVK